MVSNDGGRILALHRKPETPGEHGLPKPTVPSAQVTVSGFVGDFNRWRHEKKQDDPAMAVLLLPQETIEQLNREGWPVRPGDLGENITSSGLPYDAFSPGRRFRAGGAVLEVTKDCAPCDNLYLLPYVGEARGPEFLQTMKGRRGWYARVVSEGAVHTGDPLVPLPPSTAP